MILLVFNNDFNNNKNILLIIIIIIILIGIDVKLYKITINHSAHYINII